ncbi:hypothetical protein [Couchioplanes caeruleus]|uniref:Uncharacterized protein n=2 Tax=Couchioplanes caeruleus TaxID=56438 RepID=A0A1K0GL32_9ACTN|nr:hypothetical protein [Couchioplanes caeruleus]OJF13006.1 hypothetical protein BG844_17705 [Couchioplanes caeruleus subsp. caeruleus]ROP33604.1 hypothetical protein EDD30_6619 [Couchioplanes caeruleus]
MTAAEEHEDIKRIRHRAADASMGFGLIAILIGVFTGTSAMLPGFALLALGGLAGIGVYAASDTTMSRWFTLWSASLTVLGVVALIVINQLAG